MPPEPVTTSVWLEQQVQRAVTRIESLAHEVDQLRELLRAEQSDSNKLRDELALLNGRTARHEANLDQVRALQQQLSALQERIEAEAALRRDRADLMDREERRESEAQQATEHELERLGSGLEQTGHRLGAIEARLSHLADDVAGSGRDDTSTRMRFELLERRIGALAASARREDTEQAAVADAIPELRLTLGAIEARTRAMHEEQQRLENEIARLTPPVDIHTAINEALDQVRSLRERVEARLSAVEGLTAETSHQQLQTVEQHALLRRELANHEELLRGLVGIVESQRETLIEYVRRATAAAEDAGRRRMQEIDRQARIGRELLSRLTEESKDGVKEQPL